MDSQTVNVIQTIVLVITLIINIVFTIINIIVSRVDNNAKINAAHRDLWLNGLASGQINRIFDKSVDLETAPVTLYEKQFITLVFLHNVNVYRLTKFKTLNKIKNEEKDIQDFMSYPIPRAVWEQIKCFQDPNYVEFIDSVLSKTK